MIDIFGSHLDESEKAVKGWEVEYSSSSAQVIFTVSEHFCPVNFSLKCPELSRSVLSGGGFSHWIGFSGDLMWPPRLPHQSQRRIHSQTQIGFIIYLYFLPRVGKSPGWNHMGGELTCRCSLTFFFFFLTPFHPLVRLPHLPPRRPTLQCASVLNPSPLLSSHVWIYLWFILLLLGCTDLRGPAGEKAAQINAHKLWRSIWRCCVDSFVAGEGEGATLCQRVSGEESKRLWVEQVMLLLFNT